jgi:hypothetical protein
MHLGGCRQESIDQRQGDWEYPATPKRPRSARRSIGRDHKVGFASARTSDRGIWLNPHLSAFPTRCRVGFPQGLLRSSRSPRRGSSAPPSRTCPKSASHLLPMSAAAHRGLQSTPSAFLIFSPVLAAFAFASPVLETCVASDSRCSDSRWIGVSRTIARRSYPRRRGRPGVRGADLLARDRRVPVFGRRLVRAGCAFFHISSARRVARKVDLPAACAAIALDRGDFVEHATTHRNALWFSRRSEKVPREQKGGQEPAVAKCSPRKTRLPAKGSGRRPRPQKDTRGITA